MACGTARAMAAGHRFSAPGFDAGNGLAYLLATHHDGHDALWVSVFNSGPVAARRTGPAPLERRVRRAAHRRPLQHGRDTDRRWRPRAVGLLAQWPYPDLSRSGAGVRPTLRPAVQCHPRRQHVAQPQRPLRAVGRHRRRRGPRDRGRQRSGRPSRCWARTRPAYSACWWTTTRTATSACGSAPMATAWDSTNTVTGVTSARPAGSSPMATVSMIARADDAQGQSARLAGHRRGPAAAGARRTAFRAGRHALAASARPATERHAQPPDRRPGRSNGSPPTPPASTVCATASGRLSARRRRRHMVGDASCWRTPPPTAHRGCGRPATRAWRASTARNGCCWAGTSACPAWTCSACS